MKSVFVEAFPLLKRGPRVLVILLGVPLQHAGIERDADAAAKGLDNGVGLVQQVVGIDEAYLDSFVLGSAGGAVRPVHLSIPLLSSHVRADQGFRA